MLLSHRTSVKIRPEYSNIIGHMCYAASKLWNICNYERHHYKVETIGSVSEENIRRYIEHQSKSY